ncbi:hypothetical protein CDAR_76391 [Caerostris darwini]|uniref:Uncharacterized protein n=1 Tax=Caerostris darwini TaxID=1538125 RepID=A0AAV4QEV3_9ARAC|nr:hypothetical protein CDAR_76391 [Caerostris darwini]
MVLQSYQLRIETQMAHQSYTPPMNHVVVAPPTPCYWACVYEHQISERFREKRNLRGQSSVESAIPHRFNNTGRWWYEQREL